MPLLMCLHHLGAEFAKAMQICHSERSEESILAGMDSSLHSE